jgi:hypothetical protein
MLNLRPCFTIATPVHRCRGKLGISIISGAGAAVDNGVVLAILIYSKAGAIERPRPASGATKSLKV